MPLQLALGHEELRGFCRRWHVTEFALFGSVLRDDFDQASDVDVLLSFAPGTKVTLFDMVAMQDELQAIAGRDVHLLSRHAIERSRNALRRDAILSSAKVLDVA